MLGPYRTLSTSAMPDLVSFAAKGPFRFGILDPAGYDGDTSCPSMEGVFHSLGGAQETINDVIRWHKAGVRIDYFVVDAPFYNMVYNPTGCHFTVSEAAKRVAVTMRKVLALYPLVKVVFTGGPPPTETVNQWLSDATQFVTVYKATMDGNGFYGVSLDIAWTNPWHVKYSWHDIVRATVPAMNDLGLRVGLYINADGTRGPRGTLASDSNWMTAVSANVRPAATEASRYGLAWLDIASWTGHPTYNLPETSPLAQTHLIDEIHDQLMQLNRFTLNGKVPPG